MHPSGPHTPARKPFTAYAYAYAYLSAAGPALTIWSTSHTHLREVTRADVLAHLENLQGYPRADALNALRSLFAWVQKNKRTFRNPTSRIHSSKPQHLWQLLQPNEFRQTIEAATPQQWADRTGGG